MWERFLPSLGVQLCPSDSGEVAETGPQHSLSHQRGLRPGESMDVPGEAP